MSITSGLVINRGKRRSNEPTGMQTLDPVDVLVQTRLGDAEVLGELGQCEPFATGLVHEVGRLAHDHVGRQSGSRHG